MTTQANIPNKWYVPFANGDTNRVELPVTTADPTRASQTLGFPPLTMQPPESGGVPPQGEDFNGGMNQIARVCWWVLNGGGWPYDATFATNAAINGYPNGAKLQSADFRGDWISTADGNTNNPDTNGTNWVPGFQYGVTALTGLTGGTTTLTPAQAAKNTITLTGTLTSALTLVVPAWLKEWTVTNNTTGAFVTIVKTPSGSGSTIPQNGAPTPIVGDGTNITATAPNGTIAVTGTQVALLSQAGFQNMAVYRRNAGVQQVSINNGAFTGTGATTFPAPPSGRAKVRIWAAGGGSGGGSGGNGAMGGGGGGGGYVEYLATGLTSATTITIGAGGSAGAAGGAGGQGGTSSFGAVQAFGGTGGQGMAGVGSGAGGVGGGGSGSTTVLSGQAGGTGYGPIGSGYVSGTGGGAFGSPPTTGPISGVATNGFTGSFPGGGASGANNTSGNSGGDGLIIIEY